MVIDRIHYEQLFPTGVYANQRLRAEATVSGEDNLTDCYKKLQRVVEDSFTEMNPQIQWHDSIPPTPTPIPETQIDKTPEQRKIDSMIKDMSTVTDLKVLESYKFLAKKYPEIKEAYEAKLKELQ